MKFKVGDKVKVIGHSTICNAQCSTCEFLNETGIITSIAGKFITIKHFPGRGAIHCSGFEEKFLEFADASKNIKVIKKYGIALFVEALNEKKI